jgi:hypothetical protein
VSDRIDELRSLAHLLDDGKISENEYDSLKTEVLEDASDRPLPIEEAVKAAREPSFESGSPALARVTAWFVYATKTPHTYLIGFSAGILALLLGWRMWPLPWLALILGTMALVISKEGHGRWMAWVGLVLGGLVAVIMILMNSDQTTVQAQPVAPAEELELAAPSGESLGVRFDTLRQEWNALELAPLITSEIRPTPEPGGLDSFLHRFDGSSVLAGAYDPIDQSIYAFMARTDVRHESASGMYLHLCHLLHPGYQECLTTFIEENNLFGKSFEELAGVNHDRSWLLEGDEWRLTISGNVATFRVQSPGGAG